MILWVCYIHKALENVYNRKETLEYKNTSFESEEHYNHMNKMYLLKKFYILWLYNKSPLYNMRKNFSWKTYILCVEYYIQY